MALVKSGIKAVIPPYVKVNKKVTTVTEVREESKNDIGPGVSMTFSFVLVANTKSKARIPKREELMNKMLKLYLLRMDIAIIGPIAIAILIAIPYQLTPSPLLWVGITSIIAVPKEVVAVAHVTPWIRRIIISIAIVIANV